jgi:hypothetical protein
MTTQTEMETGRALCELLDLGRHELGRVAECVRREDYPGALAAFRDRIVDLAATLDPGELPGFWLWAPTDAGELLRGGGVATMQYGEFDRVSRYVLGPPGAVEWNRVPDDGYDVVLRDLATMHWTGKLLEAHLVTPDASWLEAYLGYWADFARRWYPAHQELLRANAKIEWDRHPHVQKSIRWASESKLYFAWRLDNLFSWFPGGIAVDPDLAKRALDPLDLAVLVLHVVNFEIPGALRGLEAVGTPNQFVHCALGLLKTSLLLQDLRDGRKWTDTAIERMVWYAREGGYLADGSDMEQSFNYNPGLIHSLDSVLQLARDNPPLAGVEEPWMATFARMRDYRERFLDSLLMPDGRRPATGCDNTWKYSREAAAKAFAEEAAAASLGTSIRSHLLGDRSQPTPGFTSIYLPFGGWVAMRNGWTPESHYAFMKTSRPAPGHMREGGNGLALAAYGRYFVVNSGADAYSDRGVYDRYFDSTVSQSSVSVDGYSQLLNERVKTPRYDWPIPARWRTSASLDFAEGIFESAYGGWNFRTGEVKGPVVDDVRHVRQLLFLRESGIWIVTDRLSGGAPHDYSISYCLGPEFTDADVAVDSAAGIAVTGDGDGPNIELRFSSASAIALSTHYGEKNDSTALGWRALDWDEERELYTPAVDLFAELSGAGEHVVSTLIVPSPRRADRIVGYRRVNESGVTGFDANLSDGTKLIWRVSTGDELEAGTIGVDGEALLLMTSPSGAERGIFLGRGGADGYEFEIDNRGDHRPVADIGVPAGFRWVEEGETPVPAYE